MIDLFFVFIMQIISKNTVLYINTDFSVFTMQGILEQLVLHVIMVFNIHYAN
jgi:hypothetical protein